MSSWKLALLAQLLQLIMLITQFKIIGNVFGNWIFCFDSNYPALNPGQTVGNLSGQQQQQHGPKSSSGNPGNIGQPHYQAPAAAGANQPFLQQQQHGMHALALPNASSYANSPAGVASTAIQYNPQRQLSQNGVIVFHTHTLFWRPFYRRFALNIDI